MRIDFNFDAGTNMMLWCQVI